MPGGSPLLDRRPLIEPHPGQREHEPRVDAVFASLAARPRAGAGLGPARACARRIARASQQLEDLADDGRWIAAVDPGRTRRRTYLDAAPATGAAVDDLLRPRFQTRHEGCLAHAIASLARTPSALY